MRRLQVLLIAVASLIPACAVAGGDARGSLADVIRTVQPKMVKIYGAGGYRGLEAYQSGFLISPEGHVLTVWSYVLDSDEISVVLHDGRHCKARLLGADPRLEIAVLKLDAADLAAFNLSEAVEADAGTRVLAVSNLFGVATGNEPASVQRGTISIRADLDARRGAYETPYHGPVYVLDAVTNNPGAAGGALVNLRGQLLAMLGKELRNAQNNTWLNHALPIAQLHKSVDEIRAGRFTASEEPKAQKPLRPMTLAMLGLVLVPEVVERTPPYVEHVLPGSLAAKTGLRPDDLVLLVGDRLIQSCKSLRAELELIDFEDPLRLTVQRGQELMEVELQSSPAGTSP